MSTSPLRSWRERHGLSQADVAGLTGLSVALVSRIENGDRNPRPLTKVRIAKALGIQVAEIFPASLPSPVDR